MRHPDKVYGNRLLAHALEPHAGHLDESTCTACSSHDSWCMERFEDVACSRRHGHTGPHIACYQDGGPHYNNIWQNLDKDKELGHPVTERIHK